MRREVLAGQRVKGQRHSEVVVQDLGRRHGAHDLVLARLVTFVDDAIA